MKKKWYLPMMLPLIFTVFISSETVIGQTAGSALEEELQKLREAGIPTTIEELNLPDIPDAENAALIYQKVFDLLDKNKEDILDKFRDLPSYSDITKWTEDQKKEMSLFIASQLSLCHHPLS
jgi:hypothetical protein